MCLIAVSPLAKVSFLLLRVDGCVYEHVCQSAFGVCMCAYAVFYLTRKVVFLFVFFVINQHFRRFLNNYYD